MPYQVFSYETSTFPQIISRLDLYDICKYEVTSVQKYSNVNNYLGICCSVAWLARSVRVDRDVSTISTLNKWP